MPRFVSIGECMIEMSEGEAGTYRLGYAGDTLNTAWYVRALLPADWKVDYVTGLGTDLYSARMRAFIEGAGIGTGHCRTIPERRPGLYLIHQAEGDRHFTYWRETSAARLLAEDAAALDEAFRDADLVYFSGITLAILGPRARGRLIGALARARDAGARIAFDPNLRPSLWSSARVMASMLTVGASIADMVLPTHTDEAPVFSDADSRATAARYLELGVEEVAVKDGAAPAIVGMAGELFAIAPPEAAEIVDATGAGDAFNGAYISARLTGSGPAESAAMAHRVAGIVIGRRGALVPHEDIVLAQGSVSLSR